MISQRNVDSMTFIGGVVIRLINLLCRFILLWIKYVCWQLITPVCTLGTCYSQVKLRSLKLKICLMQNKLQHKYVSGWKCILNDE